jgi:hypothetical protein
VQRGAMAVHGETVAHDTQRLEGSHSGKGTRDGNDAREGGGHGSHSGAEV